MLFIDYVSINTCQRLNKVHRKKDSNNRTVYKHK